MELVAASGLLVFLLLVVAQAVIVGYALWSAGDAARTGARAAHVDGNVEDAALSALPTWLGRAAEVETGDPVEVRVRAPALLPGMPSIPVAAATALGAGAGDG